MNLRSRLALLTVACAALPAFVSADETPAAAAPSSAPAATAPAVQTPGPAAPAAQSGDEPETELEGQMGKMGKALKKLRKEVADPAKNEDSLKQLAVIEAGAKASASLIPAKAADIPAAQRDAFVAGYRQGIQDLQTRLSALEAALKAGKNDQAATLVTDLLAFEHKEHKEYRKPENH